MSRLYKIEDIVKEILKEMPETRDDDFRLVAEVYFKLNPDIVNLSFPMVMLAHKTLNLPYFESITRSRRKLQAEFEELRPSKEVEEARINKQSDYINYAIDSNRNSNFMNFVDSQD